MLLKSFHTKKIYLGLILIIAFCSISMSDSSGTINPVIPILEGEIPNGDFERLEIPLKRVDNLFLIEARIDSLKGNFIFDTGASNLVLNKTYFRNRKLSPGTTAYGIGGASTQVFRQAVDSLIILDLFFKDLDADVVNLGHIETAKGVKILGLLGASLFLNMECEIDVRNSKLIVYKIDKQGERIYKGVLDSLIADIEIPLEVDNTILFLNAVTCEKSLRFCLDTGAEINVLSNMVSNKVLKHFSLTNKAILGGSSDQDVGVLRGVVDEMAIGSASFKNMPFVLTGLTNLETVYNTSLDGILGFPFLANGKVIINTKKKKLYQYFYKEETR